ncbi:MAG: PHP domain-containing protein [Cetobacterium sp.]|uniref:PHP domain-containing protein n=1 Tax=Cetobacterium sp. TaxID=2071632 RepID=UPI003F3C5AB0
MKKYFIYHAHSTYSKMDSTMQIEDYTAKVKDMGHTALCYTEHGNASNWIKKKQLADKAGLKYVHGVEAYLCSATNGLDGKKLRENHHVILLAKNYAGVQEINELITLSSDKEHMYYRPRLTFGEFFEISDNVIKISACMGGVLNKIDRDDPVFDLFVKKFDFLEIQYHNCPEQIEYNRMLAGLGKPLIAGTDTHELTKYGQDCRAILMKAKGLDDEEIDYDLTIKNYDELVLKFREQSSLPEEIVLEAIENTNVLEDMIEPFDLDYSFKYPTDYEDEHSMIVKKCYDKIKEWDLPDSYYARVDEEIQSFAKVGMEGFMLYMGDVADYCIENFYPYGPGRGSVTGSLVAYLLEITDVDPMIWDTNFSRFVNDSRISLGDIDVDFAPEDRINIYNYIRNRSTDKQASYIGTFGKLSTKSIIDNVSRALGKPLDEVSKIKDGYAEIEKEEKLVARIFENGAISEDEHDSRMAELEKAKRDYVAKFDDIFHYYDGLNGVIVAEGKHACGMIGSPINIRDSIGLRYDAKSDCWVSQCDMKNVDSVNFVKFDVLSLKTLQVIKHTYQLLGKKIPKAREMNWDDQAVYDSMVISPVGLFQMESASTFAYMCKFGPKSVRDLALVNAFVRPSCDSFREDIVARNFHPTPSKAIDNVLRDTYGRLVYQEQIITFLQEVCGFSGQDADNVRRCIGKKDMDTLLTWVPKIEAGYVANSDKEELKAKVECSEFLQVMRDAGSYSFSYNHSLAYSMITYMTAYLRHYHPKEFVTAYLNNASDESDIQAGTELAKVLDIEILNPKFGKSGAKYTIHGNSIYKGIESVLYVSEKCAQTLLDVSKRQSTFLDVLIDALSSPTVNTRQIKVLTKVEFFSEFGQAKKLFEWFTKYEHYISRKTLKKDDIPAGTQRILEDCMRNGVEGFSETAKMYKIDSYVLLRKMFKLIRDVDYEPSERIVHQLSYLGYIQDEELKHTKVGVIATNKTRLGAYKVDFINGTGGWYKFPENVTEPTKGDMIVVNNEGLIKNGRYSDKVILSYDKITLDRNTK